MLLDAGLIQFGWFERDGAPEPVALHLEMVASFPDILARLADECRAVLDLSPI